MSWKHMGQRRNSKIRVKSVEWIRVSISNFAYKKWGVLVIGTSLHLNSMERAVDSSSNATSASSETLQEESSRVKGLAAFTNGDTSRCVQFKAQPPTDRVKVLHKNGQGIAQSLDSSTASINPDLSYWNRPHITVRFLTVVRQKHETLWHARTVGEGFRRLNGQCTV